MVKSTGFLFGPPSRQAVHLCIDMQRLFGSDGPWPVPWMDRILPAVGAIAGRFPDRTVFTRFIPPQDPGQMPGAWRRYYRHWREVTLDKLDPRLLELMPPLQKMVPPGVLCDKAVYSAFHFTGLHEHLTGRRADTVILTGGETDVCVTATALAAVDHGYRVILVADALCSSSDQSHDALLGMFNHRYSQQIETVDAETLLSAWER